MKAPERFTLTIELGNDAMFSRTHIANALEKLAKKMRERANDAGSDSGTLKDHNGNTVGKWELR